MAGTNRTPRPGAHGTGNGPLLPRRVVPGLVRGASVPARLPSVDRPVDAPGAEDLSRRVPGELVTRELVRRHETAPPPSRWARLTGRSPIGYATAQTFAQAVGERHVGALLADLGPRWHVLHALPLEQHEPPGAAADVDHLVMGPAGVWVVETTNRPSQHVWVVGHRGRVGSQPVGHVRAAGSTAERVARLLSAAVGHDVVVRPVVAVVGARSVTAHDLPPGMLVTGADALPDWLRQRPAVLSSVAVDRIAAAAADPRTWGVRTITSTRPAVGDSDAAASHGVAAPGPDASRRREQLLLDRLAAQVLITSRLRRSRRLGSAMVAAAVAGSLRAAEPSPSVEAVLAVLT